MYLMIRFFPDLPVRKRDRFGCLVLSLMVICPIAGRGQTQHAYFIDCSSGVAGDGTVAHPWNSLAVAEAREFAPGDRIALARGTECKGSFAPKGSGTAEHPIRLTAYGKGPRPHIAAPAEARQAVELFDQSNWQVDSLDISGGNLYGLFVSGDKGPVEHIHLKNLYVHDVMGGTMKNKDNGLVIVGPSGAATLFTDVLVDGVDVAHSNQWSGIMLGGGNFKWGEADLNRKMVIRNSTAHDVFGDGIILFRDAESKIANSAAWQIGMEPTQDVGTPNAIWTWTCTDCVVEDSEAYLTDSPGVDGGAYDIDWDNTRNVVQRSYAHDTQGYCIAVFAAGYTTTDSVVRENLCIDNGMSPRLAALQGAMYIHTWNDGPIKNLRVEHNTIEWNPPALDAAAIVNDALIKGDAVVFAGNRVISHASRIYNSNAQLAPSANTYATAGEALFTLGDRHDATLAQMQAAGMEKDSVTVKAAAPTIRNETLRLEATLDFELDADGLMADSTRAQLLVLRSLAGEYAPEQLTVAVHLRGKADGIEAANALDDFDDVYRGALKFTSDAEGNQASGTIRLLAGDGSVLQEWHGFENAATLGGTVRARIGAPRYAHMQKISAREN